MKCISCGAYFKQNAFNRTNECDDCSSSVLGTDIDEDLELELDLLRNPSGKVRPVFYDYDVNDPEADSDSLDSI